MKAQPGEVPQAPGGCLRVALAVGGLRDAQKKCCVYMSYVPLRKDETGTSQKCRLGSFSGAAAMGWDLCDALGTFGPSPNLVKQGRVLEGAA